jgi:hypothetical protein
MTMAGKSGSPQRRAGAPQTGGRGRWGWIAAAALIFAGGVTLFGGEARKSAMIAVGVSRGDDAGAQMVMDAIGEAEVPVDAARLAIGSPPRAKASVVKAVALEARACVEKAKARAEELGGYRPGPEMFPPWITSLTVCQMPAEPAALCDPYRRFTVAYALSEYVVHYLGNDHQTTPGVKGPVSPEQAAAAIPGEMKERVRGYHRAGVLSAADLKLPNAHPRAGDVVEALMRGTEAKPIPCGGAASKPAGARS